MRSVAAQPVATTSKVFPFAPTAVTCGAVVAQLMVGAAAELHAYQLPAAMTLTRTTVAVVAPVRVKETESRLRGLFAFRV